VTHDRGWYENWQPPVIEHNKLTKWGWWVTRPDNLMLGKYVDIGAFTYINALHGIVIEDDVEIGGGCAIYSISTIDGKTGTVTLKKGCRIGAHSVIMPGVTVGENTVVGALSYVNCDLPDNVIAFGVPARVQRDIVPVTP
jgi:acetyltransferase-like isoleucine patch superfamily enzyme